MEKIRVTKVHVLINCYWGNGMSGGDRRSIELVKRWKNVKARIIVYTTKELKKVMISEGIDHVKYVLTDSECTGKEKLIPAYRKRTLTCIKEMRKRVKKGDRIYSTTDILPDVYPAYKLKRVLGKNIRWSMISYHIYEAFYKRPGNIVSNFVSCSQQNLAINYGKIADVYLTTSPLVYDHLSKKKKYTHVTMVDNAVDIDLIEQATMDEKGFDAVFLARLNYSKGIFELPEIWRRVIKQYPKARLGIIGKGSDKIVQELKQKIKECNVEKNIDVLGFLESEKAFSMIKHSKLFLFTSHEEGWGMAIAEAMVCGIPVVAYDLPVFSYLFKEGIKLCKLKDTKEMADRVCEYLSDKDRREEEGRQARKFILEHYSLDIVAQKEIEFILG